MGILGIYCKGEAIIQHRQTNEIFRIDADELDWQQVSADEGGMGTEIGYEAYIEHEELGDLRWNVQEYPVGVEDYRNTDVNEHVLLKDVDFGLTNSDEYDFQDLLEEIVEWFHDNFEDPANQTPHDSSEGGYIYIWGGPYDAHEVISEHFDRYPEEVISAAVRSIEKNGTVDWAPKDGTPFHNANDEDQSFDQDLIDEESKANLTENLILQVSELQALIEPIIRANPGIGHNNPPEEISDIEIPYKDFEELSRISDEIKSVVADETSTSVELPKKASKFQEIGSKILNWLGARANALIDGAIKGLAFTWVTTHNQQIQDAIKSVLDILSQISG